jgi:hypothetical protein
LGVSQRRRFGSSQANQAREPSSRAAPAARPRRRCGNLTAKPETGSWCRELSVASVSVTVPAAKGPSREGSCRPRRLLAAATSGTAA